MLNIDVLKFDHSIGAHRELGSPLISQKLFVLAFTAGLEGFGGDTERHERLWTSHLAIERVGLAKLAKRMLLRLELPIGILLTLIVVILPLLLCAII